MPDSSNPDRSGSRKHKVRYSADEKLLLDRLKNAEKGLDPDIGPAVRERPSPVEDKPGRPRSKAAARAASALPASAWSGCYRLLRLTVRVTTWIYLLVFGGIVYAMHEWGQANVTSAALMYLPPLIWVAPAFALLLPVLVFDWKSLPFLVAFIVLFFTWHLEFQMRSESPPAKARTLQMIRVLTWNRGQGKKASLSALKNELKPDFILLQDAKLSYYQNNSEYSEFRHMQGVGEFAILSRWPLVALEEIRGPSTEPRSPGGSAPWGIRCVAMAAGHRCALYSMHLPTPRDTLQSYKRGAFLWGIIGLPGTPWEAKKLQHQAYWNDYLAFSKKLQARVANELGPVIVAGDFNTPAMGPLHHDLSAFLRDAHLEAGAGFGYTFPGDTNNPLALMQPWLRLDQIHVSSHWQILHCSTHTVPAQHFPVFAEFNLPAPDAAPVPLLQP